MTYQLPELSYDYNALEPQIDAKTMEIHHTKHHGGYVAKLNAALAILNLYQNPFKLLFKTMEVAMLTIACFGLFYLPMVVEPQMKNYRLQLMEILEVSIHLKNNLVQQPQLDLEADGLG